MSFKQKITEGKKNRNDTKIKQVNGVIKIPKPYLGEITYKIFPAMPLNKYIFKIARTCCRETSPGDCNMISFRYRRVKEF